MLRFLKKALFSLIVVLAIILLWPFWPSGTLRDFSLLLSVRLLLLLAAVYGTLALADFVHDRWKKGML